MSVLTRADGYAFARWLEDDLTLTPTETSIIRVLGVRFGSWMPSSVIIHAVYRQPHRVILLKFDQATLRTHIWRMRKKLEPTPWRIENRYQHGLYRLIHG